MKRLKETKNDLNEKSNQDRVNRKSSKQIRTDPMCKTSLMSVDAVNIEFHTSLPWESCLE